MRTMTHVEPNAPLDRLISQLSALPQTRKDLRRCVLDPKPSDPLLADLWRRMALAMQYFKEWNDETDRLNRAVRAVVGRNEALSDELAQEFDEAIDLSVHFGHKLAKAAMLYTEYRNAMQSRTA